MADEIGAKIVVSGDTSGARAEVKQLRDETGQLVASTKEASQNGGPGLGEKLGQGSKEGAAALKKLHAGLTELASQIPGASGAISALGEVSEAVELGPLAALGVAAAAVAGALELTKRSIEAFSEQQVADTKLDQALANSGQLTDAYREKLQRLGAELQEETGIIEERWTAALAKLTQFGADDTNIEQYADGVKNLAGLMGGDIERASQIFARAINGNFTILGRLGIQVDKSADQHAKLEDVMRQLAERGGGQLEARTHTIAGQFTTLENATEDVFKGVGNLISQTGLLQEALTLLSEGLHLFADLLPKTVQQVEGLTNKLPPLKDEAGHVKGAVDELGEGMEDMGDSADSAAAGLERAGDAATKAKEQFDAATAAAKKLREQQDAMAEAKTALALAKVDEAETRGTISSADANRERAQIRADAEQASIDRKVAEQRARAAAAEEVIGRAHAQTTGAASARANAEADYNAATFGQFGDKLRKQIEEGGGKGVDVAAAEAKRRREQAQKLRAEAESGNEAPTAGHPIGQEIPPEEITKRKQEADTLEAQAAALDKVRAAYITLRQAREDEANAAKKEDEDTKKVQPDRDDAYAALRVLGVQQQAAATKANTEQAKLARDAEKKHLEDEQRQLEHDLKNTVLPDSNAAAYQQRYHANQLRLNALQFGGDKAGLAVANATLPLPPGAEANVKTREQLIKQIDDTFKDVPNLTPDQKDRLTRRRDALENANAAQNERGDSPILRGVTEANRAREQAERDEEGNPADASVAEANRARALTATLPSTPGTVSAAAIAAVNEAAKKILQDKGANAGDEKALADALSKLLDALVTKDSPSRSEFAQLAAKVAQTSSQIKNQR